jgi:hypothetical protein
VRRQLNRFVMAVPKKHPGKCHIDIDDDKALLIELRKLSSLAISEANGAALLPGGDRSRPSDLSSLSNRVLIAWVSKEWRDATESDRRA